jgi:hypothetical protein
MGDISPPADPMPPLPDEQSPAQNSGETPDANVVPIQPSVQPAQLRMLGVTWGALGVTQDEERREYSRILVGRDFGDSTKAMSRAEAIGLIDKLVRIRRDVLGDNATEVDYKPTDDERRQMRAALEQLINDTAEQQHEQGEP